ncbi:peptidase associated domain and porin domain-containing protein [Chitinophaga deserti]|uniref:outer membrane beta-barrel protein n=1 Tax=Chitinophaga deserti TaxID=2164099 RepID=UPI000D6D4D24|nr:outer membrane beta-barrel protein [Chitinophaga deserti]
MRWILTILAIFAATPVFAWQAKPVPAGEVRGTVRDPARNFLLRGATLAVYRVQDSLLLGFQLSNSSGEFSFRQLPSGIPLRFVASYVGYTDAVKTATLPAQGGMLDLKDFLLESSATRLKEFVVQSVPPVRMNGDTLEFNADAFRLDSSAVVEDLLRKINNVTIWGDGTITVNGREISQVLVNGKPFFGGATKLATQNLPKNSVDKIQVYKQQTNNGNPYDSTSVMNIRLKSGRTAGKFGKTGAGYGTGDRFDAEGSISLFNPKMQLSLAGAANNTNRDANDMTALLNQQTFRSSGVTMDMQPDFRRKGRNDFYGGGAMWQYDFRPNAGAQEKNLLSSNLFIRNDALDGRSDLESTTQLAADSQLVQRSVSRTFTDRTRSTFGARYENVLPHRIFYLTPSLEYNRLSSRQENTQSAAIRGEIQSTGSNRSGQEQTYKGAGFQAYYQNTEPGERFRNFRLQYDLQAGDQQSDIHQATIFRPIATPGNGIDYDRKYNRSVRHMYHTLTAASGNLTIKQLGGIQLSLQNELGIQSRNEDQVVTDVRSAGGHPVINYGLTHRSEFTSLNIIPGLYMQKSFYRKLTNRYEHRWLLRGGARMQFYRQELSSNLAFRNYDKSYSSPVPEATVEYQRSEYGSYSDWYRLTYKKTNQFPEPEQLVPLADSIRIYYFDAGNPFLRHSEDHAVTFTLDKFMQRRPNDFTYKLAATLGLRDRYMTDSSLTDNTGRTTRYIVNANGYRYGRLSGEVIKPTKFNRNLLNSRLQSQLQLSHIPYFVNSIRSNALSLSHQHTFLLEYAHTDRWAVHISQSAAFYRAKQSGLEQTVLRNRNFATQLSVKANAGKRLSFDSNVTYNRNASSAFEAIGYTIWNAGATCRFLRGNNAEIRLHALDLLRQNTAVVNTGFGNRLTTGTENVLTQYFMLSVAYYPRQFKHK